MVRTSERQFNLTCHAEGVWPRPRLALYRFRAAKLEQQQHQSINDQPTASGRLSQLAQQAAASRPRLAATLLRQEPILEAQVEVGLASDHHHHQSAADDDDEPPELAADLGYRATTWTTIDESSLSSNAVTQFECLLQLEGIANFERRQALALQRGEYI